MKRLFLAVSVFAFSTSAFCQPANTISKGPPEEGRTDILKLSTGDLTTVYTPDGLRFLRQKDNMGDYEYLFAKGPEDVGISVHVAGTPVVLTVRYDNHQLKTNGMPLVDRLSSIDGRHDSLRLENGERIATFTYAKGYLTRVKLDEHVDLHLSQPENGKVTETLIGEKGAKIRETTVPGEAGAFLTNLPLDPVAKELGLPDDWRGDIRVRNSNSGLLSIITRSSGVPVMYIVYADGDAVGFDLAGRPLFYDFPIDTIQQPQPENPNPYDFAGVSMGGVTPNHVVVTHTGTKAMYVEGASEGAINSIWTGTDDAGHLVVKHRVSTHVTTVPSSQESADRHRSLSRPAAPG